MSKMTPEELMKRQKFLKEQRDKLLDMKKQERQKQLGVAEKANPDRPRSARIARTAMHHEPLPPTADVEEDRKKMAMRKAIADRLKAEVIGK